MFSLLEILIQCSGSGLRNLHFNENLKWFWYGFKSVHPLESNLKNVPIFIFIFLQKTLHFLIICNILPNMPIHVE